MSHLLDLFLLDNLSEQIICGTATAYNNADEGGTDVKFNRHVRAIVANHYGGGAIAVVITTFSNGTVKFKTTYSKPVPVLYIAILGEKIN